MQTLVKRIRTHIQTDMQSNLIENMLFIDLQTDLYNRQYFNDCFKKQISCAKRNDDPLSLIIFKLKIFELFDGLQSSLISKKHIKAFATLISNELSRPTDTLFRFSENEFTVLLPDTYIRHQAQH